MASVRASRFPVFAVLGDVSRFLSAPAWLILVLPADAEPAQPGGDTAQRPGALFLWPAAAGEHRRLTAAWPRYSRPALISRSQFPPSFSTTHDSAARPTNVRSLPTCARSTQHTRRKSSSPRPTKRWTSCFATGPSCLRRFRSCTCPFRRSTCNRYHRCRPTWLARRSRTTLSAPSNRRLRWHPAAGRLVVVTGASPWDQEWEARLRAQAAGLPQAARRSTSWPACQPPNCSRRLRDLPADTIVFTPGFFRDGSGREFTPREASQLIAAASSVPVYGLFSTFIGTGIVGGRMASYDAIGRLAARDRDRAARWRFPGLADAARGDANAAAG